MSEHPKGGRRITSEEIGQKMGVSLNSVYVYRSKDKDIFPRPVGYSGRTALFDEAAIDAYIAVRSTRGAGQPGRPPRTAPRGTGPDASFPDRLREAVAAGAGAPEITTLKQLAETLSLNPITLGERLRSRTAWQDGELTLIRDRLGIDTADANTAINAARAARRAERKKKA